MKLNNIGKKSRTKTKGKEGLSSASFNLHRDELLESTPVDLRSLGIVARTADRPRFSRAVTAAGRAYRSIAVSPTESVYFLIEE